MGERVSFQRDSYLRTEGGIYLVIEQEIVCPYFHPDILLWIYLKPPIGMDMLLKKNFQYKKSVLTTIFANESDEDIFSVWHNVLIKDGDQSPTLDE